MHTLHAVYTGNCATRTYRHFRCSCSAVCTTSERAVPAGRCLETSTTLLLRVCYRVYMSYISKQRQMTSEMLGKGWARFEASGLGKDVLTDGWLTRGFAWKLLDLGEDLGGGLGGGWRAAARCGVVGVYGISGGRTGNGASHHVQARGSLGFLVSCRIVCTVYYNALYYAQQRNTHGTSEAIVCMICMVKLVAVEYRIRKRIGQYIGVSWDPRSCRSRASPNDRIDGVRARIHVQFLHRICGVTLASNSPG
jgi:hypothetical protein